MLRRYESWRRLSSTELVASHGSKQKQNRIETAVASNDTRFARKYTTRFTYIYNAYISIPTYISRILTYRNTFPLFLTRFSSSYEHIKIRVRLTIRSLPRTRIYIYKYSRGYINTFSRQRFNRSLQQESRWQTWTIHIHRRSVF